MATMAAILKNLFFTYSPEPKGQLTRTLVGSFGVTCRSKNTVRPVLKATHIKQSPVFKGQYFRPHFRERSGNIPVLSKLLS